MIHRPLSVDMKLNKERDTAVTKPFSIVDGIKIDGYFPLLTSGKKSEPVAKGRDSPLKINRTL
jgi:hypothetical protein